MAGSYCLLVDYHDDHPDGCPLAVKQREWHVCGWGRGDWAHGLSAWHLRGYLFAGKRVWLDPAEVRILPVWREIVWGVAGL